MSFPRSRSCPCASRTSCATARRRRTFPRTRATSTTHDPSGRPLPAGGSHSTTRLRETGCPSPPDAMSSSSSASSTSPSSSSALGQHASAFSSNPLRRRRAALEQCLVQLPVGVDRVRGVARVDVLAGSDELGNPAPSANARTVSGSVSVCASTLAERQPPRLEYASDKTVELEERIARIVPEALLQVTPFALPYGCVEAGLSHAGVVPRGRDRQTPQ